MIQFQIFESDNKFFHFTIEIKIFTGLAAAAMLCAFPLFEPSAKYLLDCIIFLVPIMLFANGMRVKPLNGNLIGTLTFNKDNFQIDNKTFHIDTIKKIILRIDDYEGKSSITARPSIYPRQSNGTNNLLRAELKSGELKVIKFKAEYPYDYHNLQPFVLQLLAKKLISIENACELLNRSQQTLYQNGK